jgi:hypothetical protein
MLAVYQRAAGVTVPHYAPPVGEAVTTETGSLAMSREASS